jgi:hypothetical protein
MGKPQELIPITIKKKFNRDTFPGRARLDSIQHEANLTGKTVERSVGDAMFAIKEAKQQLMQRIENYMNLNKLATTAKLPDSVRPIKLVKDILDFIKQIKEFIQEIQELIQAIMGVIGYLQMMLNRIVQYIQKLLNAIATLIAEICNFNLPDLPAIPSIFGSLYFDGFQFPSGAFKFAVKFDANFAFGACKLRKPNLDIFRNYPKTKFALGPSGVFGVQPTLNPPLPNSVIATSGQVSSTAGQAALRAEEVKPYFVPDFFPQDNYVGALPKSNQIVSSYKIPAHEFKDQVLSLLGGAEAIIADMNPAGTFGATGTSTSTADQAPAGQLDNTLDVEHHRQALQPAVRAYSVQKVTLENIVDSGWDWKVVWAWLTYAHQCREARSGYWIPAFQAAFDTWVRPGFMDIDGKGIPWHTDPEFPEQIKEGPASPLLFTATLQALPEASRIQALWMLSYVEASLLGYTRSTRWDSAATTTGGVITPRYATGPTRDDLDYQGLPRPSAEGTTQFLLDSKGKANYPSVLTVPEHVAMNVQATITQGFKDVSAAGAYTATRMASRYVYTQTADTLEINFHSQFWKDFVANWNDLLLESQGLQDIVWNYPEILNSAINPLASRDLFQAAKLDFLNRDFHWIPGTPYLPTPFIPTLILPPMQLMLDIGAPNGWGGLNDGQGNSIDAAGNPVPLVFSPSAYAARPDIASLPPNVQDTLIFFNQAYADLAAIKDEAVNSINASIADGMTQVLDAKIKLALAESYGYVIPDGQAGMAAGAAPGAPLPPAGTGTPPPPDPGTGTGGGTVVPPPSGEATVFITPEDALTDIVAIAANGILAAVEKPRMVSDMTRIESEKTSIMNAATALLSVRPELQPFMTDTTNAWAAVMAYLSGLSPAWNDTTLDTTIGPSGFTVLQGLLTTYYGKFILLDQQVKTAQGGGQTFSITITTPSTVWVVDHGFHRFPDVTVFDENGNVLWADIRNITIDRLEVHHGSPRIGSVLCR